MISTEEQAKQFREVLGKKMAYVDEGQGPVVLFLHGNPTSSYIWRNVIPIIAQVARCIAPDLIGMGDSEKIDGTDPDRYSFSEHRKFLSALIDSLEIGTDLVLVGQDWGGALAMDWASKNPAKTRGVVYLETLIRGRTWAEMDPVVRETFKRLRSPEGEELVLQQNVFIEKLLPARMLRKISAREMDVYRRPFINPGEDRRPMLTFPRQIPIEGLPEAVAEAVIDYAGWMSSSDTPKLFINGEPGAILTGTIRELCRTWKNQEEVTVRGTHFLQEDSPSEIGHAIVDWLSRVPKHALAG